MKWSEGHALCVCGVGRLLAGALAVILSIPASSLAGVAVGGSKLIGVLDYSDTFTVGTTARPDGLYNNNGGGGYNIETSYNGYPSVTWLPTGNFSFNSSGTAFGGGSYPPYPGNTGNSGAATGMAQSGGGDFNFTYGGARNHFIVQADATFFASADRVDIGSYAVAGAGIGSANSLTVIFRRGAISLYNGTETATGFTTGVAGNDFTWHNYAVEFDKTANTISFFVDEIFKGKLDLTSFAGGIYQAYSSAAIGLGVGGMVGWWDNFQVGSPADKAVLLVDAHRTEPVTVNGTSTITTLVDAGRFVKQGLGTLTVTNALLINGTVDLNAGALEIGSEVADLPAALRTGLAFWVDANRNVELSGSDVTTWYDVREASGGTTYPRAQQYGSDATPALVQGGSDVAGLKLVDFGTYGSGRWLMWKDALGNQCSITNIRTVFMAVSCPNGYGFLLGDWDSTNEVANTGRADFHAGGAVGAGNPVGQALMNASWWNAGSQAAVVHGQTFINGDFVRGEEQIVSTIGEVMSLATTGDTLASNFGNDRNYRTPTVEINRQGGGRIGEVLIYTTALTESQRRQVESYLMKKWLGRGVGTIRVAQGTELRFRAAGTNDLSYANVSGLGNVSVMGAGYLLISALADQALPPLHLAAGATVDSGTLAQRMDQPYVLEGGATYQAANGVCKRLALADTTLIEKTGADTLTASSIASGVRSISVKGGTLRLAAPLPAAPTALTNALENASFETFTSVGTGGDTTWGYSPEGTGWTITSDMSSANSADWSGVGLANPSAGVPWSATQVAPDGNWVVFLKRAGELERTFVVPASGRYEIAFYTAARPNYMYHLYQVLVDATNVVASVRTAKTSFSRISCTTPVLAAGTHTLCFKGIYGSNDSASVIDAIAITPLRDADYVAVPNPSFETPTELATTVGNSSFFDYNPSNAGWTFVGDPAVTNSGIAEGFGPWYYADMSDGDHAAFLRQTGQFFTPITFPTSGVYCLSFRAAGRAGTWGGIYSWYNGHDFNVTLGGQQVAYVVTYSSDFTTHTYTLPVIKDGDPLTQTLAFVGLNQGDASVNDRSSLIDDVQIVRMPSIVNNPSFETTATLTNVLGNSSWQAGVTGQGWDFCVGLNQEDQSGIARNHSDWGNTVPEGSCNAFLQMNATIRQTVSFSDAGTYTLSFLAGMRPGYTNHDFRVLFDNVVLGYVRTTSVLFQRHSFRLPRVKASGSYVLSFEGVNHGDRADRASFLDSVLIAKTDDTSFDAASVPEKMDVSLDVGASLDLDFTGVMTVDRLAYNGRSYTGLRNAENTPFLHGSGSIYATAKGTLLSVR